MRLIAAQNGKLLTLDANFSLLGGAGEEKMFSSGLAEWDAIAPGGGFACGAVHELLTESSHTKPSFIALMLSLAASRRVRLGRRVAGDAHPRKAFAKADPTEGISEGIGLAQDTSWASPLTQRRKDAKTQRKEQRNSRIPFASLRLCVFADPTQSAGDVFSEENALSRQDSFPVVHNSALWGTTGVTVWCDPERLLYPPALASFGFPLDQLYLLRPTSTDPKDLTWAITESLRCKGVSAVVAAPPRLSRIEARRLQLAAERGGGVGILLRQAGRESMHHAAASRWLVRPAPGSRRSQRWTIQLLHGHGGQVGKTLGLELSRETHHVHPFTPVADRQVAKKPASRAS